MKIIQTGRVEPKPPEWIGLKMFCGCGCVFQLEQGDNVRMIIEKRMDGYRWAIANCPECNNAVRQVINL